jgi:signal transduction histidine kinase
MMRQISHNLWNNDRKTIAVIQSKNEVLARAYEDLEAQIKMRAQFISTLSHELRTPLTAAQGFLHLMNSGAVPEEAQAAALAKVTRNVEQVVAITNSLLILHEIDLISPRLAPVSLPSLVNQIVQEVTTHRDLPPNTISNQVTEDFPLIQADEASLGLALRSLIDNAAKFNTADIPVTITARTHDEGVSILVRDHGIGMSEETQASLFKPFVKADGSQSEQLFDGLGIGLVIAKFIIERHNGRIEVSSRLGEGSTLTIHLPSLPPTGKSPAGRQ